MEKTYIMVKPDGVQRGLVGEIIKRFEQKGYQLLAAKLAQPSRKVLEEHYKDLSARSFFPSLIEYMSSGPVMCLVFSGKGVVKTGRLLLGETNPLSSLPGTIRGDFCVEVGRNVCHGSDSVESAEREIKLWFPEGIIEYKRAVDQWIYE
ncbi:nucleoside diphosphate kinase [Rozella allomycis CSF55]|uniref:Nucleoside diphosphate kinase n=1 Tax=Rozella allomycis (strain CSF55) TaxID=988480 RepID=A0A075B237_ROZAC|nr:Nucleoside diphosphate kinase B [Rozella allomycis CSF55]RKP19047.1 nucleoside diphosphate kinase [Rozella allomycis CSF55]|eukprot:EPZ35036.1 Nucleoside diphosphate kinase B [Rozella allomycis CSF55]